MAKVISDKQRTLIFVNIIISCVASSMLMTALTSALPAVVSDLHISYAAGQWITSGYSLIMGIMMPLTAFLITRFPTKKLYLVGIGLSIFGLLLCIVAPNFPLIMIARGLQACGNGISTSMAQVILLTIYPPEKRGTAMGGYGLASGAAPVIAPTLAGIIVDYWGWRAIFVPVLVILIVSFVWAVFSFDNVLATEEKSFDSQSFALSVIAFGGLTLGIGNVVSYGITNTNVWPILVAGIIASVIFIRRQLHISYPFLELRVFKDKNYTVSIVGSMLQQFTVMGLSVLFPMYIQTVCGYSATISGLVRLPGSLAMAVTSLFAGTLYDKVGIKKLFIIGPTVMLVSMLGIATFTVATPLWLIAVLNIIYNISIGFLMMPIVTWGMQGLNGNLTAHGSALMNSLKTVAGSIGAALFVGIMSVADATATGKDPAYGFRLAVVFMAFTALALLVIGAVFTKPKKYEAVLKYK